MTVNFYFDFGSPNAFLCHRVIPQIEQRTGVAVDYVPVLLGGLFKLTGNQSPATAFGHIKNKPQYDALEMRRFITRHGINDFKPNPHFPINSLQLMRGAVAAQELGVFKGYVDTIYDAMWVDGLKLDEPQTAFDALASAGLPAGELLRLSQSPKVKATLANNTQAAFDQGAFGSPSFLVGEELYFGKDRLGEVEEEIVRQGLAAA